MRYYVLSRGLWPEAEPYVVAEHADRDEARSQVVHWYETVMLTDEEASLDPDWAPVVEAWRTGDNRAWAADRARGEAECIAYDAAAEALREEGSEMEDNPPDPTAPLEDYSEKHLRQLAYSFGWYLGERVREAEASRPGAGRRLAEYAAALARYAARDPANA